MASTYSTNLAIELIGTGEQSGTWGTTTNTNLGTLLEQAISGYVTQAITDGSGANTTITIPNGATGVARNMFIEMTGALTFSTTSLIVPANKKMYFIFNNTTGGFAVTVKVSGQTGILVPNGKKVVLTCNGTDIVEAHTAIVGNATMGGTLGVTGATTLSSTLGVTSATTLSSTVSFTGSTFTLDEKSNTAFATPSALSATGYRAFASTVSGAAMMGFGTTNDVSLMNRAGTVVLGVGPNTTLVNIPAALTVGTTLGITGTTTAAAINASGTVAMAGAATVGTTLAVTGATTLSSTLGVTGAVTAVTGGGQFGIGATPENNAGLAYQFETKANPSSTQLARFNTSDYVRNTSGTSFYISTSAATGNSTVILASANTGFAAGGPIALHGSTIALGTSAVPVTILGTLDVTGATTVAGTIFSTGGFAGQGAYLQRNGTDGGAALGSSLSSGSVILETNSTTRLTVDSAGAVTIPGSLSKGSGSFRISHPLPDLNKTHNLVHSFIEGPQADLIYRGKVSLIGGKATVNIDAVATMTNGTFVILCRDVQCFTTNETDWNHVRGSVVGNILTIECQDTASVATISWMVIGERQDKHMMETEWTDENGKVIVESVKLETK